MRIRIYWCGTARLVVWSNRYLLYFYSTLVYCAIAGQANVSLIVSKLVDIGLCLANLLWNGSSSSRYLLQGLPRQHKNNNLKKKKILFQYLPTFCTSPPYKTSNKRNNIPMNKRFSLSKYLDSPLHNIFE